MKKNNQIIIQTPEEKGGSDFSIGKAIFYLVGAVLTWFGLSSIISSSQQSTTSGGLQNDLNTQLATRIYNILSTAGALNWYYRTDYSSVLKVIEVAKEIKDWKSVQAAYSKLYGEDITAILNQLLIPADYQKFLNNLQIKGSATNTTGTAKIESVIPTGLVSGKSRLVLAAKNSPVNSYKSTADYPSKVYISWPVGFEFSQNGFVYIATSKITYLGSTVSVTLYQIQLPNGNKIWVKSRDVQRVIN